MGIYDFLVLLSDSQLQQISAVCGNEIIAKLLAETSITLMCKFSGGGSFPIPSNALPYMYPEREIFTTNTSFSDNITSLLETTLNVSKYTKPEFAIRMDLNNPCYDKLYYYLNKAIEKAKEQLLLGEIIINAIWEHRDKIDYKLGTEIIDYLENMKLDSNIINFLLLTRQIRNRCDEKSRREYDEYVKEMRAKRVLGETIGTNVKIFDELFIGRPKLLSRHLSPENKKSYEEQKIQQAVVIKPILPTNESDSGSTDDVNSINDNVNDCRATNSCETYVGGKYIRIFGNESKGSKKTRNGKKTRNSKKTRSKRYLCGVRSCFNVKSRRDV